MLSQRLGRVPCSVRPIRSASSTHRIGRLQTRATSAEEFSTICQELLGSPAPTDLPTSFASQLTELQPEDAKQRVQQLSDLFGSHVASSWLQTHPSLLLQSPSDIVAHLQAISDLLGFPPEIVAVITTEHPSWAATPIDQLGQNYSDLADLFSLSPLELARVIATEPSLLATPAPDIRRNLYDLSNALGVGSGPIMRAAPQFPGLMVLTPKALTLRIINIAQRLGMQPESVRSMLGASPRLASLPVDAVVEEWGALKGLLEGHENWLGQLEALPPHLAAACLTSSQLKQRLLFFRETGLLETRYVNMASILTQDDADFASKYKGYIQWLRARIKAQREKEQGGDGEGEGPGAAAEAAAGGDAGGQAPPQAAAQ